MQNQANKTDMVSRFNHLLWRLIIDPDVKILSDCMRFTMSLILLVGKMVCLPIDNVESRDSL